MGSHPKGGGGSGASTGQSQANAAAPTPDPRIDQQATLAGQIGAPVAPTGPIPAGGGLALPPAAPGMMTGAGLNWTMPPPPRQQLAQTMSLPLMNGSGVNAIPYQPNFAGGGGSGQMHGNVSFNNGGAPGGFDPRGGLMKRGSGSGNRNNR